MRILAIVLGALMAANGELVAAGYDVQQLAPHPSGTLYMALNGAIYALANWRQVPPEKVAENALKLADFTGLGFKMLKPPSEAMRWR